VSGSLISPEQIPGTDVRPESIASAASAYRATAASIREKSTSVVSSWSGLSGVYSSPDAPQLLASMSPVATDSQAIADTLTRASGLIETMAELVAAPVRRLKELQVEAASFANSVKNGVTIDYYDPDNTLMQANAMSGAYPIMPAGQGDQTIPWDQHTPSVDRNNQLLQEVNEQVAKLLAARADCVNGINALRTDECMPMESAPTVDQLNAAPDLPWGVQGKGDRSCMESVGDGLGDFGKGLGQGLASLVGWNTTDGSWSLGFAGAAWGNVGQGLGALVLTAAMPAESIALAYAPDDAVPGWLGSVRDWQKKELTAMVGGIVGTPEQWKDDPVAAGTYAAASIATFFIPVAGEVSAGGKVASVLAKVGIATEKIAVVAGDGTKFAAGLSRVGDVFAGMSKVVDRFTGGTADLTTNLEKATSALHDMPDVVPGNLTHAVTPGDVKVTVPDVAAGTDHAVAPHTGDSHPVTPHSGGDTQTQVLEHPTPRVDTDTHIGTGGPSTGASSVDGMPGGGRLDGGSPIDNGSRLADIVGGNDWHPLTHEQIAELPVVRDGTHINPDGSLQPDTWYHTGEHEYIYHTNEHGHIDHVIAEDLQFKDHTGRLTHDPKTLGKLPGDHAGHVIGDRYGGSPKLDNLVSQLSDINLSKYRLVENEWGRTLGSVPPGTVSVEMRIMTDPLTGRPTRFEVNSVVDGEPRFNEFDQ
jgi:hypothetical protein